LDLNGKDPEVGSASEWVASPGPERVRSTERRRRRRRTRPRANKIRARIRMRMWIACTGALIVMTAVLYYALGHQRSDESGLRLGSMPATVAAAAPVATAAG
jgi:hypothetical protein